jgi:hypothetical protein
MQELAGGPLCRHGSQGIEGCETRVAGFVEQPCDPSALLVVKSGNKTFPKTLLRAVPDAAHKAFKNADARQQHLVDDQPGCGTLDQGTGVVVAAPA